MLHTLILVLVPVLVMTVSVIGICLYNLSKGIRQCNICIKYMVDVLIELAKQVQSNNVDEADYD
jgi:hypothetical protein